MTADGSSGVADRLNALSEDPDVRTGAWWALGALAFFVFVGILFPAPGSILFLGMIFGSLSALVAMGLVLIYRANRIVNFAQGDIGGVAAVLAASLIVGPDWPYLLAAVLGLVVALGAGAFTEVVFIRRFAKSPRLILTVATIGLQQLFAAGQLALPKAFDFDVVPQNIPLPFEFRFTWEPLVFTSGHLFIVLVVPLVLAGIWTFFRFTDAGIAIRASAESADRATLLGIPVRRLQTLVWVIAAGLSGIAVLLQMPIIGVPIGAVLGPSLMLRALAAAVIGRMENLGVTFGAAIVLGMIEQSVFFITGRTVIVDALLFALILGALLLQRAKAGRAEDADASTWTATKEARPIPVELSSLPEIRWSQIALRGVIGFALLILPLWMGPGDVNFFGVGLIFAMIILSFLVLTGWAGQISLGQLAFVAFGAAVAGTLAEQGKDFFLSLLVAGLVGAAVAVVIGVPSLRIRGLFLAVTTLAFALATGAFFLNEEYVPWLVPNRGLRLPRPVIFGKFDLESEHAYYYVILVGFLLVLGSVRSLRRSRTGRALLAIRENTRAAQSYGISPVRGQLVAFAISGFIAAFAGGLFFYHQHAISRTLLETQPSLRVFSMAVIGGLGSVAGAMLGAGYLTFLQFSPLTAAPLTGLFASAVGLLFVLLILPGGLGGLLYDVRDALLRMIARRRDILVPSLLADVRTEDEESGIEPISRPHRREPSPDALLRVDALDVAYGRTQVLFGVDFHVEPGEMVALLGTNGAGKSTLLAAISGLVEPSGGTITYDGAVITGATPNETVGRGIVLMPGSKGVFPTLTVEENVRLAGWLYRDDPDYLRQATERVLDSFPILRERWGEKAGNLSGGEQQMLTLGQVFIAKPKLLMIDELSLGLAPVVVEKLLGIVRDIHAGGTAVVLVEQSVNIAITLADRAAFLEKGEVRFEGPTKRLLDRPDLLRAVFLKGAHATTGNGNGKRKRDELDVKPFIVHCDECGREREVVLEARDLSVSFGGIQAVDGVDLVVREGQILGIIGPNGAGKTTVFDLLSGFVEPSRGRIELCGQEVSSASPDERATLGLGRSFQDARLFPALTVRETLAAALERHVPVRDPLAAILMSPAVKMSERKVAQRVDELIELMNLEAFADKFVGELSTGTRRIVDLACTVAHDPKVVLLDEPSSGLAQRETEALGPVLLDLRDRTDAALVVVEHDMPLITSVSDELVALELGRVAARGDPRAVVEDPRVVEGYLGASEEVILRSGGTADRKRKRAGS